MKMRRLFVPTFGPSDWRQLLADPARQWRPAKSAYEMAVAWEAARGTERGLPPDVAHLFDGLPELRGTSLLLGVPEHQVELIGGGHASQTDFWALLRAPIGVVSAAFEAKAGETFDKCVSEWMEGMSPTSGKPARLKQLCEILRLDPTSVGTCRYQLLHRPAAAILEAKRFGLSHAIFLVQSFSQDEESLRDYVAFGRRLGVNLAENTLLVAGEYGGIQLWIGWLSSATADEATLRVAV